jgi:hypothetical protein
MRLRQIRVVESLRLVNNYAFGETLVSSVLSEVDVVNDADAEQGGEQRGEPAEAYRGDCDHEYP